MTESQQLSYTARTTVRRDPYSLYEGTSIEVNSTRLKTNELSERHLK